MPLIGFIFVKILLVTFFFLDVLHFQMDQKQNRSITQQKASQVAEVVVSAPSDDLEDQGI